MHMIFAILALLCFIASAAGIQSRIGLTALGLVFLTLLMMFG